MSKFLIFTLQLIIAGMTLSTSTRVSAQVQGMQTFENRKEGTNVHPNAASDLTLIAIHRNFQTFPKNSNLHVRFFLPPNAGKQDRKIFLEAVELQDSFHYFMQATKQSKWKDNIWNTFEPWPTKDVIDKLGLEPNNLGVLARYEVSGAPTVYLPVDVYQSDAQSKKGVYTFHFITASDLQALDVSVANAKGVISKTPRLELSCNKKYNPNCKLFPGGSTESFTLDMSGLPPGEFHIKLLGHIPGDLTPVPLDFVIYHEL